MLVSSLTFSHSDYKSLIRIPALRECQLCWNSKTENKLHSIEPWVNVINMFRLPRQDEIIHKLRLGHKYLTHGHFVCSISTILGTNGLNCADVPLSNKQTNFKGRLPLGAWLVKWIWLLCMSCFIVFPLQILVIIVFVLLWPPCVNCFRKLLLVQ